MHTTALPRFPPRDTQQQVQVEPGLLLVPRVGAWGSCRQQRSWPDPELQPAGLALASTALAGGARGEARGAALGERTETGRDAGEETGGDARGGGWQRQGQCWAAGGRFPTPLGASWFSVQAPGGMSSRQWGPQGPACWEPGTSGSEQALPRAQKLRGGKLVQPRLEPQHPALPPQLLHPGSCPRRATRLYGGPPEPRWAWCTVGAEYMLIHK